MTTVAVKVIAKMMMIMIDRTAVKKVLSVLQQPNGSERFPQVHHNYLAHKQRVRGQGAHSNSSTNYAIINPLLMNSFNYYPRKENGSVWPLQPILHYK